LKDLSLGRSNLALFVPRDHQVWDCLKNKKIRLTYFNSN
jgi:hypothetical protein